ncbi:MAG: hypothetical protein PUB96_08665 [Helicobacteraceae bacterium]|nr:hypothetical protein [Helicobacteraceae bacterium]
MIAGLITGGLSALGSIAGGAFSYAGAKEANSIARQNIELQRQQNAELKKQYEEAKANQQEGFNALSNSLDLHLGDGDNPNPLKRD